jgi:hypothetical protein
MNGACKGECTARKSKITNKMDVRKCYRIVDCSKLTDKIVLGLYITIYSRQRFKHMNWRFQ